MKDILIKIIAYITTIGSLLPSLFGLSSAYLKYENSEKYDPSLGQIIVDTDMSVPRIFLTQDGSSDYLIIRGENASPSEITAATTLQDYFKQISGVTIPVVTDTTPAQTKEIVIGKTNREGAGTYTINRTKLGDDGLNVFVYNEKLVIAGGEQRGTLYGVYTFLEEVLGCRWFAPALTNVPNNPTISARRSLYIEQVPIFEYRDHDWLACKEEKWNVANKINGSVFSNLSQVNGGGVKYQGFVHTIGALMPESQYFEAHPEYYAYTENGKRETTQPCLTNPEVLHIVTENALKWLRNNPNADIISISQNDGYGYCECDNCKAVDEAEGTHMGTMLRFVNAVAQKIGKEFPDVQVDTLAYVYTRVPPKITKPCDNVIIRLCSFECCFSHPIAECTDDSTGRTFAEDLRDWQKICENIYVWDYTTNFGDYPSTFPNIDVLQPNIQFFAENNVKGVFEEGNPSMEYNGEFSHLKTYLIAKLLWDPYTDVEKHMNEFMRAFYGEGYQYIRKFIDLTQERSERLHFQIFSKPNETLFLSTKDIEKCDAWWDAAEKATKNEDELYNVQGSRIQLRYYKNYTRTGEFSLFKNKPETGEALYDDMVKYGITTIGAEKPLKPKEEIDFNRRVRLWR